MKNLMHEKKKMQNVYVHLTKKKKKKLPRTVQNGKEKARRQKKAAKPYHDGKVLVEKREWTSARWEVKSGCCRSRKYGITWRTRLCNPESFGRAHAAHHHRNGNTQKRKGVLLQNTKDGRRHTTRKRTCSSYAATSNSEKTSFVKYYT